MTTVQGILRELMDIDMGVVLYLTFSTDRMCALQFAFW